MDYKGFEFAAFKKLIALVAFIFSFPRHSSAVKLPFNLAGFHERILLAGGETLEGAFKKVDMNAGTLEACGIPAIEVNIDKVSLNNLGFNPALF
jgi:hypothetical protein